jgi:sigma-B regulation protein RsbU (phosphoserine phosphatase)
LAARRLKTIAAASGGDHKGDDMVVDDLQFISTKQMQLVLEASRSLAVVMDLDALLPTMAQAACELLGCSRASVWLHDGQKRQLRTRVALGSDEIIVPDHSGVVGAAFTQNAPINISNPYDDPRFNPEVDRRSHFVTQSLLAAPMVDLTGKPVGVIQAVNKIAGPFTGSDQALICLLADQIAVAIQRYKLHEAAARAQALRHEMTLARKVQRALLPEFPPVVDGLLAAGWTKPASITGGDCYDLWTLPDGRLGVLLADASGHGLGPSMVVSQVRTMVRLLCDPIAGRLSESDPTAILAHIDKQLRLDLAPDQFVTAFLGFVSPAGEIQWASAGHGPVLIKPSPGAAVRCLDSSSVPLGVWCDDLELDAAKTGQAVLEPGGTLLVMSDGIFEACDSVGNQFGTDRVMELLERCVQTPADFIDSVRQAVEAWHLRDDPVDDQTLVAVHRRAC